MSMLYQIKMMSYLLLEKEFFQLKIEKKQWLKNLKHRIPYMLYEVSFHTYKTIKANQMNTLHLFGHVGICNLYLQNNLISKSSFYGLGYECVLIKIKVFLKKLKIQFIVSYENNLIKN